MQNEQGQQTHSSGPPVLKPDAATTSDKQNGNKLKIQHKQASTGAEPRAAERSEIAREGEGGDIFSVP